ncbi:MAG: DoxX subfamily [Vicinamibacterales bacterium]
MVTWVQRAALILARTLVGWHFLYEGFYKLMLPGWSLAGAPLGSWSAAAYLQAASGPLAPTLHRLAASSAMPIVDIVVPVGLVLVGLSLMLGLFTQLGCAGAAVFLALFYVSAIPLSGLPQSGAEGTYLIVNKTLIELGLVLVIATFRTGRIAGLDVLRRGPDRVRPGSDLRSQVRVSAANADRRRSTIV